MGSRFCLADAYGYDAAGRTTSVTSSVGITTLTYDFESRVTQITGPGINATYSYNGLDTRDGKTENSVANTFRRSGAYVTDPVHGGGTSRYTPGASRRTGTETRYFYAGLVNANSLTNTSQTVAASYAGVVYLHENDDSWREGIRQGMSRRAGFDVWAY